LWYYKVLCRRMIRPYSRVARHSSSFVSSGSVADTPRASTTLEMNGGLRSSRSDASSESAGKQDRMGTMESIEILSRPEGQSPRLRRPKALSRMSEQYCLWNFSKIRAKLVLRAYFILMAPYSLMRMSWNVSPFVNSLYILGVVSRSFITERNEILTSSG
jgi:hypothetical protein